MYDCIIVGSGPAGASTAYELARSGARVLILEKMKLPRYKTCGGGIPLQFFRTLPENVRSTQESIMTRCIFMGPEGRSFKIEDFSPSVGVMRDRFDQEFVRAACLAGAELRDNCPVLAVEENEDGVAVKMEKETFHGRFLVGADGVLSTVRKSLGIPHRFSFIPALEVEIPSSNTLPLTSTATIHLTNIQGGYAWAFPKKDVISIGVGSFGRDRTRLREKLDEWILNCGLAAEDSAVRGHLIPFWQGKERLSTRRSLLAGDAAGTADPFTGEGIRHSILSGRLAARFIREALATDMISKDYDTAIFESIQRDFIYAKRFTNIFFGFQNTCFNILSQSPSAAGSISRILGGELSYRDVFRKSMKLLFSPWRWPALKGSS